MLEYKIRFTKWDRDKCERINTHKERFTCRTDSFKEAFEYAETLLAGMRAADPNNEYEVLSISSEEANFGNDATWERVDPFDYNQFDGGEE